MDPAAEIRLMARIAALEHAVTVMISFDMERRAKEHGMAAEELSREFAQGLVSTVVEARFPEPFKAELLTALRELGDSVVANGRLRDELG
jgi:HD-GYP domain-containing protein (c-di-GMP phosphodiesterase class II)